MHHLGRPLCSGAAVLSTMLLVGCSDDTSSTTDPDAVTYQRDVRAIVEKNCQSCHVAGGPTPYDFTYPEGGFPTGAEPEWAAAAAAAVEAGRMPPWMPADDCRDYAGERRLTDDEKTIFSKWAEGGFVMGAEADFVPPPPPEGPTVGEPSLELLPDEAYTPDVNETGDDYRCFILPYTFDEDTFIVGSSIVPGEIAMAHHALIYRIPAESVETIEGYEAEDDLPGYSCFGGPGSGVLETVGGWVPGAVPNVGADDSALVVPAGSRLVLQMHYNTLAFGAGAELPADKSTVRLWTTDEQPTYRLSSIPLAHLAMEIEPFESESVQERVYTVPTDATIVAVAPHMHLLGTSIEVSVEKGGDVGECLVDVPAWDFHWQQQYAFTKDARVDVKKGDQVRVRCTYDNSMENQPVVDGTQRMPSTVWWGEGTLDEMCLAYVVLRVPFDTPDFRCGSYPECQAQCADGDGRCFFDCLTVGGGQCAACFLPEFFSCAPPFCAETGIALQGCTQGCGEDVGAACLLYECGAEWDAFYACMEPHLEAGECNDKVEACAVSY